MSAMTTATATTSLPRAQRSVLRIATTISFLLALIPLIGAIAMGQSAASVLLALTWVMIWGLAVLLPERTAGLVARWPGRVAVIAVGALAVTIVATGGPDSGLKNGLNWLPWVYLVAASTPLACVVAAGTSAAIAAALFVSAPGWVAQTDPSERFFILTEIANPLLVAAMGVVLVGVFHRVLLSAHQAHTAIAASGAAGPSAGAPLIAGVQRPELPVRGLSTTEQTRAALRQIERDVVDLLTDGFTPQQIAWMQQRSVDSVYRTISSAKQRTGTRTIEQLVACAWSGSR